MTEEKNTLLNIRTTLRVKSKTKELREKLGFKNLHQLLQRFLERDPKCDFVRGRKERVKIHGSEEKER